MKPPSRTRAPRRRDRRPRRDVRPRTALAVLLGALLLIGAAVLGTRRRPNIDGSIDSTRAAQEQAGADGVARRPALPSIGTASLPPLPPSAAAPAEPSGEQVASLMKSWHAAIVTKNAETVENLDRAFAAQPDQFIAALMENAENDPEERVRSFSTRVLGKLRRPESVDVLHRLLKDSSEYVRFNAAWALGELGDRDAAPKLLRMERHDPSAVVRQSAGNSRRKIEGS